jgi:acetyltransferase-like isoleucine patch superfamily enzyme
MHPVKYARGLGVKVGEGCRLEIDHDTFGSEPYLVTLGDHVTIAANVDFVTHDGGVWVFRERDPDIDLFAPIVIERNVFVGMNSIILPGVTVGADSVIGAGSVVSRSIPPGSVAVGVPCRRIKSIDEYWEKVKSSAIPTKRLTSTEKRAHLERVFKLRD